MDGIRERANFLKNAIFNRNVGAVTMSSKYVIKNVTQRLGKPLHTVIEYGPGDGVMTRALLLHLAPQGKLFVIESNPQFIKALHKIKDKRLHILQGKVQDLALDKIHGFCPADAVISSIPFSLLKKADRLKIVSDTHKILAPNGTFIIFHQYSRLMFRPLQERFSSVSVVFEPRNILPCFILDAKK
jgi:phospholipid N-methyltransferase